MKTKSLFLSAILAIAAVTLTACSSDSDVAEGTELERGVVKTEFTISFPSKVANGTTRMSGANVQVEPSNFRGIRNIELYPFSSTEVTGSSSIPSLITLWGGGTVGARGSSGSTNNTISSSGALYTTSNSHLYQNVDIPVGTAAFMFYGEADRTSAQTNAEVGALEKKVSGTTLDSITFNPVQINSANTTGSGADSIATYLTLIANTKVGDDATWATSLNVGLSTLYNNFITMHAGSWTSVKAALREMYTELSPKTEDNDATKAMKNAIRTSITNADYGVSADGSGNLVFSSSKMVHNYPANLKRGELL